MNSPLLNALLATLYICVIGLVLYWGPQLVGPREGPLVPIVMLSLFVLSAAIMGYFFLSESVQLYLDGQKQEAINFFLKTVALFACITALLFLTLVFIIPAR